MFVLFLVMRIWQGSVQYEVAMGQDKVEKISNQCLMNFYLKSEDFIDG